MGLGDWLGPIGMGIGTLIAPGVGTSVGGLIGAGLGQALAGDEAAEAQRKAAEAATAEQARQFNITQENEKNWRGAGEASLNKLMGLLNSGGLSTKFSGMSPAEEAGFKFARDEGLRAVNNRASSMGGFGGAAQKAAIRFAEENANRFYGDAFNRSRLEKQDELNPLFELAGFGPRANQQLQIAGQNYANNAGANILGAGDVTAANALRQGNIFGGLTNQLIGLGNSKNWWQTPNAGFGGSSAGYGHPGYLD
jgi:hypothetical protein